MEKMINIVHYKEDYTNKYFDDYFDYNQIHIFSVPKVYSTYYHPKHSSKESVKKAAEKLLDTIQERSDRKKEVTLFEKDGKFLIAEHSKLIVLGEILMFNAKQVRYEQPEEDNDIAYYIGKMPIDMFFKNCLITIGAEDLYEVLEPFVKDLKDTIDNWGVQFEEMRQLNKTDPNYTLEIYDIKKDYKAVLRSSFPVNDIKAIYMLPEFTTLLLHNERIAYKLIELKRNKVIEANINDTIERIKYNKWHRKNPSVMDINDIARMELDNDDPNFLDINDFENR